MARPNHHHGYQSDDEFISKKLYSKEDFKDIYCINEKAIEGLEKSKSTGFLLGCLSSYQDSPCKRHHHHHHHHHHKNGDWFTSCYNSSSEDRRYNNSLDDLRQIPRYLYHQPLYGTNSNDTSTNVSCVVRPKSVAGESLVSRESLYNEARRWVWSEQLDRYIESSSSPHNNNPYHHTFKNKPPTQRYSSAPLQSTQIKHVSFYASPQQQQQSFFEGVGRKGGENLDYFTRSFTENSLDASKLRRAFLLTNNKSLSVSQERLIDGKKTPDLGIKCQEFLSSSRTSLSGQKTQATQTENFIASRASGPSDYLSLSPRVAQRSRMVSQPTQTNGFFTPTTKEEEKPPTEKLSQVSPTEEEFHENLLQLFSPTNSQTSQKTITPQTIISRSPSNKSCTSSEGSYSLVNGSVEVVPPPVDFADAKGFVVDEVVSEVKYVKNASNLKKKKKSLRAKSEERYGYKIDASTQSSISLHASLHDLTSVLDDDDSGLYVEPYESGIWVYIGRGEEANVWMKHEPLQRANSGDSTEGEREFSKRFVAMTHRMVHRKASGECYRRLAGNCLEINKRALLTRTTNNDEYGFRIHGSRPVVVSAVESASPAETAGLEVGDVIMSINGVSVLDSSHSDVVRIASSAETLEMELARTRDVVERLIEGGDASDEGVELEEVMNKFNGLDLSGEGAKWVERLFTLTKKTLQYSKKPHITNDAKPAPLRILSLTRPTPLSVTLSSQPPILTLSRQQQPLLLVSADYERLEIWKERIVGLVQGELEGGGVDEFVRGVARVSSGGGGGGGVSDCDGWLWKLGRRIKTWSKKYCVLKDGALFFYADASNKESAIGATFLQGYRVQTVSILGGKKNVFELVPPELSMRTYYFSAESDNERKRWLAALEYSIDRWVGLHQLHHHNNFTNVLGRF